MKALLVGIDHHEDWGVEQGISAAGSLMRLGRCLRKRLLCEAGDIVVLANAAGAAGRPTLENILDRLCEWTRLKESDEECILFYFSGHGTVVGGEGLLLPVDARMSEIPAIMKKRAITLSELAEVFAEIRVGQRIVILNWWKNMMPEENEGARQLREQILTRDLRNLARAGFTKDGAVLNASAVLLSCYEQRQTDGVIQPGHGAFIRSLTEVLEEEGEAEVNLESLRDRLEVRMEQHHTNCSRDWGEQALTLWIEGRAPWLQLRVERTGELFPQESPAIESAEGMATKRDRRLAFGLPPTSLLGSSERKTQYADRNTLGENSSLLEKKVTDLGIKGRVVKVHPGPVVTTFEFDPSPHVKIGRIMDLADDLALALQAISVRIVAPIPGKSVVGIEVPNPVRETVFLKEVIDSVAFQGSKSKLSLGLGKNISGEPYVVDLRRMPHLLVAGSTGSGKSVSINSMICSILFKATPDKVRLVMVDTKMQELSDFDGIPHLLLPVVTNLKKAAVILKWLVEEMERRYTVLAGKGVRGIEHYHQKAAKATEGFEGLPYIVVVVDDLADLMMVASREVEESITRLAQMARAVGIHMILATQRPSVDILTGIIKANFPARIAFQVASKVDSRTILDTTGAEHLLGSGDMLFLLPGSSKLVRLHGAFISSQEIRRIVKFLKKKGKPLFEPTIDLDGKKEIKTGGEEGEEYDEKYDEAVTFVTETGEASISLIQRRFRIGYNRAARIVEKMEEEGVVGPTDGIKPRRVLIKKTG